MTTWQNRKLGEVADILMGQSPPSNTYNSVGVGIPFFQGKADFNDLYPTINKYCSKPVRVAGIDDILLSVRAPIGPVNLSPSEICIGRGLSAIKGKQNILNQMFLFYFMKLNELALAKKGTGSTFSSINRKDIENINLPLPSLSIQRQIVEKLDAIRKLQELNQKEIEKAKELFDSFITNQLSSKSDSKKYRFVDISTFQYGLTAEGKDKGKYRFIRITDIDEDGQLRSMGKKYVEADGKQVEKYLLKDGDLLVARTGATYGKFVYCEPRESSVFASYLIKLTFKPELALPRFVWLFTRTESYWIQARKLVTGSGQPQFNANRIKEIEIPLPSLIRQKEIVAKAKQLLIYSNGLRKEQIILKELFESMLNKAMMGELVN